jgi:Rnl2 family RNA ligase
MVEFSKYRSIQNVERIKFIAQAREAGLLDGTFVVEEKVHGGNFSYICDGETIQCAMREGLVGDRKFFHYERALERDRDKVFAAYKAVAHMRDDVEVVHFFGELFGGFYDHPDVTPIKNISRVGKGVCYSPDQHFYGFDIKINDKEFLPPLVRNIIYKGAGMLCAEPLFVGTFDEAMALTNEFQTTIPDVLGLPSMENNLAEGLVIKPEFDTYLKNGRRLIFKNHNPKWKEKANERKVPFEGTETPEFMAVFSEVYPYITENRFEHVLSHVGTVSLETMGKFLGLVLQDINKEFEEDFGDQISTLDHKEQKQLRKRLGREVVKLLKPWILENETYE